MQCVIKVIICNGWKDVEFYSLQSVLRKQLKSRIDWSKALRFLHLKTNHLYNIYLIYVPYLVYAPSIYGLFLCLVAFLSFLVVNVLQTLSVTLQYMMSNTEFENVP